MNERRSASSPVLAGSLLLAHPSLRDRHFRKTVILLSTHDNDGAMGVVLNRPLGKSLGELDSAFAAGALAGVPLFEGGPVHTSQVILCAWRPHPDQDGYQLMFGIDPQKAEELIAEEGVHLRAFLGYAGWTGGQLEEELKHNTWLVSQLVADLLDDQPGENLWRELLGQIDQEWRLLANEPEDPSLN
ncbi:MAG: YqgE/AlgH family protein [Verrucomicrobia bacterium]|nr:YqgE/AlgH family protein [Verrucomicrobiota bacterium]